ncbi:MAG: LysR family transcriptional regulator [Dechloromonas sp.]|nr:LysR family transcriptional regulator [Dechloromonas sp.]
MNLNQLHHLIALSEHYTFSRAADAMNLTQPALSRSIQSLEEDLGVRLIDRVGKKNYLTPQGRDVVARARKILFEASEIRRSTSLSAQDRHNPIRIGFGPSPAALLQTPFLRYMAQHHPAVRVKISRGSIEMLSQALRQQRVDIIAIDQRALVATDDLSITPLASLRAGFLCRAGHPLLQRTYVDLEAVRNYSIASTPLSEEVARQLILELGSEAHPNKLVTLNSEDINGLLDVVETTDAVFLGIFAAAKIAMAAGRLRELRVQPHAERQGLFALATLAGRTESPSMTLFRDFAQQHFHD